jgi:YHS domain-containing protein
MKNIIVLLLLISSPIFSQDSNQRKKQYLTNDGIAISGYDPVTYFMGKPQQGKKEIIYNYEGVTYQFLNATNAETFKKTPAKYEPQYGGWCAYAMGDRGEKVEVDPQTYKIVNGKLYLFYHKFFSNTLTDWNKDESNLKIKADNNWTKYLKH